MSTPKTHLVTGGTGFLASHTIRELLSAGHTVHATVRSTKNASKLAPLTPLKEEYPDKLFFFEADLLNPGSFREAMEGCHVVHHMASPFILPEKIKDPENQLVKPALEGTRNVLNTVNEVESVHRVVLTSTIASMMANYVEVMSMPNKTLTEEHWNTTSSLTNAPYPYSKKLAEQEAWKIHDAQSRWTLVVINPGLVFGPSLTSASASGSLDTLDGLFSGKYWFGVPDLNFPLVDVRDVALAHRKAAELGEAKGRYIICLRDMMPFVEVSKYMKPRVKSGSMWLPTFKFPTWLLLILAPLVGMPRNFVKGNLGYIYQIDNSRSIKELGIEYRPVLKTLDDHYEAWYKQKYNAKL